MLTNSPVEDMVSPLRQVVVPMHDWLRKHSRVYEIASAALLDKEAAAVKQRKLTSKDSENAEFVDELNRLGEAIAFEMSRESSANGAVFVLVTGIDRLHQAALDKGLFSIDVRVPMHNQYYTLPDGLAHFNEAGSGVIAWEIAKFLRANHLIPDQHINAL